MQSMPVRHTRQNPETLWVWPCQLLLPSMLTAKRQSTPGHASENRWVKQAMKSVLVDLETHQEPSRVKEATVNANLKGNSTGGARICLPLGKLWAINLALVSTSCTEMWVWSKVDPRGRSFLPRALLNHPVLNCFLSPSVVLWKPG